MPTYQYEAMNSVGQVVKSEVEANSQEEAIAKIRAMGHFPTKIKERTERRRPRGPQAGPRPEAQPRRRKVGKVPAKVLTQFTRQLSTLQDAGLPILRSLRILEQQQKPGALRLAIRQVADDVESGAALSEAMAKYPKAFDKLYTNMVAAGEAGGVLDVVLRRLADFMEASQRLKRRVVSAMIYPIAVITFATLVVTGIMLFIVPKFEKIYAGFNAKLPGITKALISFSNWVRDYGWAVILGSPLGVFLLFKLLRQSQGGRYFVDALKLKLPLVGGILAKTAVARFSRTLGTLLAAGVPILEAISITRETAGSEVFNRALAKVHDGIREGEDFAEPLRQAKIVEPMVVNMIDVGEETGELDKMLSRVADTYDEEVQSMVAGMVSMLEPVMVVILGVIVGFVVIAIFTPLPALISAVQNQQ